MNYFSGISFPKPAGLDFQGFEKLAPSQAPQETSFIDFLGEGIQGVNTMQHDSDQAVHEMLTGADVNSAEVLTTVQKADMSFRLLTQIRNKLLSAYEELNAIRI